VKPALALPGGLEVRGIEVIDAVLIITAVSIQKTPCCPHCGIPATRVHSRYTRQVADLPCSGQQVRLLLKLIRKPERIVIIVLPIASHYPFILQFSLGNNTHLSTSLNNEAKAFV
jgi:hypothetical protein